MSVTAPSADHRRRPPRPSRRPWASSSRRPTVAAADAGAAVRNRPDARARPCPVPAAVAPQAPRPERETSRLRRLLTVGGTMLGLFGAYQILVYFVAYTDDAYVRSDLVAVASEVTGRIIKVHVVDNQDVKRGDTLFSIDPVPFQLVVNQRKAEIDEAKALVKVAQEELVVRARRCSRRRPRPTPMPPSSRSATPTWRRAVRAARRTRQGQRRSAPHGGRDADLPDRDRQGAERHRGAPGRARSGDGGEWRRRNGRSRTQIVSPTDGAITNLTVRPGDTGNANVPIIGIVDADAWRIMANYKQDYIRSFKVGGEAWVWLDSQPFRLPSRAHRRHRPRHQPRSRAGEAAALRGADHRLDPPAAAHPGDHHAGRPAARPQALHGRRCADDYLPMKASLVRTESHRAVGDRGLRRGRPHGRSRAPRLVAGRSASWARDPARTRQCLVAAIVVPLATTMALWLEVDSVWWAAISGYMTIMATGAASLRSGLLRIAGTIGGAVRRLHHGAMAALRSLCALPVPGRRHDAGRRRHAGQSARARLAVRHDHLHHGAAEGAGQSPAGRPRRLLSYLSKWRSA